MRAVWASGDAYEPYVGRWSRAVATEFLTGLGVGPGGRWLDVGCGTGALSGAILMGCEPAEVVGIDPSDGYVAWAAAHIDDPRARFEVTDATHLPDGPFDAVVSGLVAARPDSSAERLRDPLRYREIRGASFGQTIGVLLEPPHHRGSSDRIV